MALSKHGERVGKVVAKLIHVKSFVNDCVFTVDYLRFTVLVNELYI